MNLDHVIIFHLKAARSSRGVDFIAIKTKYQILYLVLHFVGIHFKKPLKLIILQKRALIKYKSYI
ncbi:hypothetical protein HanRHA438_Chr15g0701221 [Helianthus annuus]|nr:hypothetical protein HanIR_Chr15g0748601 [Helianthus annuus]KAJ0844329.1 hypothetical protein HanRHA438_Chr15g0701221 [Helianthus annuus]